MWSCVTLDWAGAAPFTRSHCDHVSPYDVQRPLRGLTLWSDCITRVLARVAPWVDQQQTPQSALHRGAEDLPSVLGRTGCRPQAADSFERIAAAPKLGTCKRSSAALQNQRVPAVRSQPHYHRACMRFQVQHVLELQIQVNERTTFVTNHASAMSSIMPRTSKGVIAQDGFSTLWSKPYNQGVVFHGRNFCTP